MTELYRGLGGMFHPYAPRIDSMIIERAAGVSRKEAGQMLFASTDKKQCVDYAKDNSEDSIRVVVPATGAIVHWIEGVKDMTLAFERHIRDLQWNGVTRRHGAEFGRLLRDASGDIYVIEQYLEMGRQRKAVGALADDFVKGKVVHAIKIADDLDLAAVLAGHDGEVWIKGRCDLLPLPDAAAIQETLAP